MTWNPSLYDKRHSFVFSFGNDVLALLEPQPNEYILDLGCGTGHLTKHIAKQGARVIGMDASKEMLAEARKHYPNLEFVCADAANFSLSTLNDAGCRNVTPFDAVFSNATLHWIPEAEEVLRSVYGVLRHGGRFIAEFGGKGNVQMIRSATRRALNELTKQEMRDTFYFPSPAEYATLLERNNFRVEALWHFDRPTPLDGDDGVANWLRMFGSALFHGMDEPLREQVILRAQDSLRSTTLYQNGIWTADYVRLRIVARKQ